jgi:hypothetical protein
MENNVRGGSTLCCCPLSVHQQNKPELSTAGSARSSRPLTVPAYFAIADNF